jgi:NAD+ diphosphatase
MNAVQPCLFFRGSELLVDGQTSLPAGQLPVFFDDRMVIDRLEASEEAGPAIFLSPEVSAPEGTEWQPVRLLVASEGIQRIRPILKSLALFNWRMSAVYCGRCGAPMFDKTDETARICSTCASVVYPRLSPAIIALVTRDERILLARNASFKTRIFSLVAGFVEAGENFEECIMREVLEETGVIVRNVRYRGSQSWPFPESLMVGFEAEWNSGEIVVDGTEIVAAGWFGPGDPLPLPMLGSLSRTLIDGAFAEIIKRRRI